MMNRAFWEESAYFCLGGLGNQHAGVQVAQAPPMGGGLWDQAGLELGKLAWSQRLAPEGTAGTSRCRVWGLHLS